METRSQACRFTTCLFLGLLLLATTLQSVQGEDESEAPSQCRPFIEKALKEQLKEDVSAEQEDTIAAVDDDSAHGESEPDTDTTETPQAEEEAGDGVSAEIEPTEGEPEEEEPIEIVPEADGEVEEGTESVEEMQGDQPAEEESLEAQEGIEKNVKEGSVEAKEESAEAKEESTEAQEESTEAQESVEAKEGSEETKAESTEGKEKSLETEEGSEEAKEESTEVAESAEVKESVEDQEAQSEEPNEGSEETAFEQEGGDASEEPTGNKEEAKSQETGESQENVEEEPIPDAASTETPEDVESVEEAETPEANEGDADSVEKTDETADSAQDTTESVEATETTTESTETTDAESAEVATKSAENADKSTENVQGGAEGEQSVEEQVEVKESVEEVSEQPDAVSAEVQDIVAPQEEEVPQAEETTPELEETSKEGAVKEDEVKEEEAQAESKEAGEAQEGEPETPTEEEASKEAVPEEDLILDIEIPENLRPRDHIDQLLKLDVTNDQGETIIHKINELTLKELKKLYENAIKPLETLYKYRDLSNRHFGDSEIFSKPLVVFMGPWSGGKSSIVNYLLDNEYNSTSLRAGAEPSPAYFNLVMHGSEPEVLDGTQLAADFTFAGLQKFGQGLEERLRGLKLPNKLLEKINIVEIPGILEVRKQVSRVFPFNDACQWFIDRADIIFLVYDPSKLDVGPETEAILDQLKGREHQTRIVLNKADQVKPEELMRVQSALIWNISPLMSSAQPPVMYTTSLWSRPYEAWAPVRLLQAQERAFLRDLRSAVDKRIENKIASARRFAVRVRNHAKMVDCYLTTYYNHKSVFGNRKQVADQIIEHPQDYHIYEGLSTLTNISRYDLPDPEVYRDFFRLNPLYDFQQLSATCTYFRGCPINRLDVAIAYDLPELVGKHKKQVEAALAAIKPADNS